MDFYGEYIDVLVDVETGDPICGANTSELQEWLRAHPSFRRHAVVVGATGAQVDIESYLKLPNVNHRHPKQK